jgi:hypothetical protein
MTDGVESLVVLLLSGQLQMMELFVGEVSGLNWDRQLLSQM